MFNHAALIHCKKFHSTHRMIRQIVALKDRRCGVSVEQANVAFIVVCLWACIGETICAVSIWVP